MVEMVAEGKLRISGVQIDSQSFMPGDQVGEFFGLSDDQLEEMKRLGFERLRERQNREQSLAMVHEVSDSGIVFELPADSEFSSAQAAEFTEDLRRAFGPDVAAMLEPSINQAYADSAAPRLVRYRLTRRDELANVPNASEEIRAMHAGMHHFSIPVNQNEDGSFMTDEQGMSLRGGSHMGTVNLNDTKPESFRPRYHFLWEREMSRR